MPQNRLRPDETSNIRANGESTEREDSGVRSYNSVFAHLIDARQITTARERVQKERDNKDYNSYVKLFCKEGRLKEALHILGAVDLLGVDTYISLLQACIRMKALAVGKQVHAHILKRKFETDPFLENVLVNMYAKCRSAVDARHVFDQMHRRNVVSWTVMIAGYGQNGLPEEALKLFWQMQEGTVKPNQVTFVSILKACSCLLDLEQGKQIHAHIIKRGFESDTFVGSTLIDMYAKCGNVEFARHVFDRIYEQDVVMWNVMVGGYARHGFSDEALQLFEQMQKKDVKPDRVTFLIILKVCASITALELGKQIHGYIIKSGFQSDVFVGNALINMYAKCGSIKHAYQVFHNMPKRDVVSWNVMVAGYTQLGHGEKALNLFHQMHEERMEPDQATFVSVIKACAILADLELGKQIHDHIIRSGFESDVFLGNALVDMYAKCGSMEHAQQLFDKMPKRDVVSWNAMVTGYVQHGHGEVALKLFWEMEEECVKPDKVTFVSILKACASLASLEQGKQIHAHIVEGGLGSEVTVGSTLIDMYAKCGSIESACEVFDKMPKRDVVSWTALVAGYTQHGYGEKALEVFWQMHQEGVKPNQVTFVSILKACASLAVLEQGKQIHLQIINSGFESDIFVGSAVVDMYAKCGSLWHARQAFDKMPKRNVVSWTAMILGYAQHGLGEEALRLVKNMLQEGLKLDHITFISILSACSHAGLVEVGCHFFDSMNQDHGIAPAAEHYACMVDILSRAGRLAEAEDFVKKMSFQPSAAVWGAFLGACRIHSHLELAKHAVECILEMEPQNATAFVLLANIYAAASKWDDKARVRKMMVVRGIKKEQGCTWIEVNNQLHSFGAEDTSHPQMKEIHTELNRLSGQIADAGYIPDTRFVLHNVEEEEREVALCHHSEKLAIAFGLISIAAGTPIRIIKNLRVCGDCHSATKFISRIVGREIILRDANRFHHFKDGVCSCGDYW